MTSYCHGPTRREALRVGFLGLLGWSLSDYLRLAAATSRQPRADAVIFIHLAGGPAHLDTLDMKPEAPVEEQGEFRRIASKIPGVPVCEHLAKLGQALDRFTLIRGIRHTSGAHPQANEYIFTGNRPSPAVVHPGLGAVASKERPGPIDLPSFVAIPRSEMGPGFLGVAYSSFKTADTPKPGQPFEVRGLTLTNGLTINKVKQREALLRDLDTKFRQAEASNALLEGLDRFGQAAQAMIVSPRAQSAFDVSKESPAIAKLFAADEFSQSLLLAGRLVEHGVRFVTVNFEGWDTHLDNFNNLKNKLLPRLDAGLPALIAMLDAKGLLRRTLVVCTGEFGRTPTINRNAGRDHWPRAMWTLMAGGGVKSNNLIGGTDKKGHGPDSGTNIKPDDLAASICHALGLDHLKEYYTPTGRPVLLIPHGEVIEGLFE
ncbi:MAG: DUF1501 domain-containing protein [Gemmataceae bacterium]